MTVVFLVGLANIYFGEGLDFQPLPWKFPDVIVNSTFSKMSLMSCCCSLSPEETFYFHEKERHYLPRHCCFGEEREISSQIRNCSLTNLPNPLYFLFHSYCY